MAESIGLASGLLTLAIFAFQSSVTLCDTVQSFRSHNKRVRDLIEELEALSDVLKPLAETIKNTDDANLSLLDRPLLRCGKACKDFEQELLKCLTRSGGNRTSFRDWAKLKYMGEDVDGFRRLLTSYKLTICIALTDANLHKSAATAESLEEHKILIRDATDDLQTRLESIDEKLNSIVGQAATISTADAMELKLIKEERLSTQKCLQICEQLSHHIDQIHVTTMPSALQDEAGSESTSERITDQGLGACKESLANTTTKLEIRMKDLTDQLMKRLQAVTTSRDEITEIERLREQWETARQCIDICTKADNHLKNNISVIDNWAAGDAVQFMVSTDGKVLHGKNKGTGWRTRQVGGHMDNATVMQLSRDMLATSLGSMRVNDQPARDAGALAPSETVEPRRGTAFDERHGQGVRLAPKTTLDPGAAPAEARSSAQPALPKR